MNRLTVRILAVALALPAAQACAAETHYEGRNEYRAPHAPSGIVVDGVADEAIWAQAEFS